MTLVLHDAEKVVIDAIQSLNLCSAYREEPSTTPSVPYATVSFDGGGMLAKTVSDPSVTVVFHADTWKDARTLALTAEKLLPNQLLKDPLCYDVSVESVYRFDDSDSNQPGCAMTLDLTLAG